MTKSALEGNATITKTTGRHLVRMNSPWKKFGLVAGFLGWNVWNVSAFIWSLRSSPLAVIGSLELHPPFLLLMACISIPVTVALSGVLFWEEIRKWFPKNRFQNLHWEIQELYGDLSRCGTIKSRDWESMLTLQAKLESLSISCPPINLIRWKRWLPRLASWADTKNLYEARNHKP